jgi:hypothetical protein
MINFFAERINVVIILCATLAFLIPGIVFWLGKKFRKVADPPWKRNTNGQQNNNKN